tara:strand:- start:1456 stop:1692 length:237 start_codon:yes stop_codon:yes gene_type:complete
MAKNEEVLHYDMFQARADKHEEEMQKLDEFINYLLGSNKEPYQIRNIITYYVAATWDSSYIHKRMDLELMEENKDERK